MKQFICLMLLFSFCIKAKSQDLFNVKYTGSDGIKYDCLFIDDGQQNLSIRIRFNTGGENYLTEIQYRTTPIKTTQANKKFLHFKAANMYGVSIIFISKEMYPGFIAPCFIWYPDKGEMGALNPLYTTTDYTNFTNQKKVDLCEQISMLDISKGRLKPYFSEGSEDYEELKRIAGVNLKAAGELPPLKNIPTLHFIMVANTADKKIGASCARDEDNLQKEIAAIAASIGIVYKPYIVNANQEKDFTKNKLLATLGAIKTAPDDIILFSYSGHGARWDDQKDEYPFMELWVKPPFNRNPKNNTEYEMTKRIVKQNSVGLSDVFELLTKKGARLNIVLGDMCNTAVGAPRPVNLENILSFGDALRSGTEIIRRDPVKLRKLFIEASGSLISNASKPMEKAAGDATAGGYYTASFVEALRLAGSYNQPAASWKEIISQTIDQALIYRKKVYPGEVQNGIRYLQIKE